MNEEKVETLRDRFFELSWQEGLQIEDFLQRLHTGEYGDVSGEEITALIRSVQNEILGNMEVKAREHAAFAQMKEERQEEINETYDRLVEKYGS